MPGGFAPALIPWRIDSSLANSGRYLSTTAEESAGTLLAPLTTSTFRALACASSAPMPQTNSLASARSR